MADGSVIIDTKIDVSSIQKLGDDIQAQFKNLSDLAKKLSNEITKALKSVDASGIVDEVSKTANDIERLDLGDTIADDIKEGFRDAEKSSEDSTEDIEADLDDVGDKADKTGEDISEALGGAFKKVLAVFSVAEIAEEVVEFGKECLELGSDLEEVQNVVDVTFETMSDRVNDFAKDAKKSAGVSEKMAKQYVGTFGAMADSFGFVEEEAYEMSTALTQLTGDVASFYNLSHDEAFTKLKSVFTGETESLKDLGVVMTQTALDAYALANGFGKTTASMTEQEKVALRYQFVMDQLSAASGDFVRTQDSWANQCKILSLQFESLMATLGTGLIDGLAPGIELLNDAVLPALQNFADEFAKAMEPKPSEELADSIEHLNDSMVDAEKQFNATAGEIEFSARLAKNYVERLDELEASGLDNAEAQREYANVVSYLNELLPDLNLQIDESTGLVNQNRDAIYSEIEAMKQKALYVAMEERYTAAASAQMDAILAVQAAEKELAGIRQTNETTLEALTAATGLTAEQLRNQYNTQMLVNSATNSGYGELQEYAASYEQLYGTTVTLTEAQMQQCEQMYALELEEQALTATIEEGNAAIAEQDAKMDELDEAMTSVAGSSQKAAGAQDEVTAATQETTVSVDALIQEYENARAAARESIDSQIGCFDELVVKSDSSAKEIIENWASQKKGFDEYAANLQMAVNMGLDEALVKQLSDGSAESMAILDEFVNDTDLSVDDINAAFHETEQSRETVSAVMADIQTDTSKKLDAIAQDMEYEWGDMADIVGEAISEAQAYIDSLTGKTVYNRVITQYSTQGSASTGSTSGSSVAAASAASVPFLAKGTVIPPNAPFLAVLGDQRHGTNVEAPLATIQEAVAAVMGDQVSAMMAGFEALLEENRHLRQVVENIELGDSTIGQAVNRYQQKVAVMRGG